MLIPLIPLPPNATEEERLQYWRLYVEQVVSLMPERFLPVGTEKRWWHLFKIEHPFTAKS
jgi:hypothetical protein